MFKYINRFIQSGLLLRLIVILAGFFIVNDAMATTVTISVISTHIGKSIGHVAKILQDVSFVCGIGFILASFFKFHQHKLQPTQVPMSQGVTLLVIGAGLSAFPYLLSTATQAAFGQTVAKLNSSVMSNLIGS